MVPAVRVEPPSHVSDLSQTEIQIRLSLILFEITCLVIPNRSRNRAPKPDSYFENSRSDSVNQIGASTYVKLHVFWRADSSISGRDAGTRVLAAGPWVDDDYLSSCLAPDCSSLPNGLARQRPFFYARPS